MTIGKKRLGEILIDFGLLEAGQLDEALAHQTAHPGVELGRSVLELGFCTEEVLLRALSLQVGLPAVHVREVEVPVAVLRKVPSAMAEELQVLPLAIVEDRGRDTLLVAMARPLDSESLDAIRFVSEMRVLPLIAGDAAMRDTINRVYDLNPDEEPEFDAFDPSLEMSVARELDIPDALQITPDELLKELG